MNTKLLNLTLLIASCLCASNSTAAGKAWLEPAAGRAFEHHKWESTKDTNTALAAKLQRLQVPEALRPYDDVMQRLRALGYKTAAQAVAEIRNPKELGIGLALSIAALPDIAPELIPVLAADKNRDHPAIQLARELAIHKDALTALRHVITALKSTEVLDGYRQQYEIATKVAAEIATDDADLPASLGLLSAFYKVMTQTATTPIVPVLDSFLTQTVNNTSMLHEFWRQLNDTERATVKRAVDKHNALCIQFLGGRYINPTLMGKKIMEIKPTVDALKDSKLAKEAYTEFQQVIERMNKFDSLYAIIRARFNVNPEISFRAFVKQFGALMTKLQGVVATAPNVAHVAGVAGPVSGSTSSKPSPTATTGTTGSAAGNSAANVVAGVPTDGKTAAGNGVAGVPSSSTTGVAGTTSNASGSTSGSPASVASVAGTTAGVAGSSASVAGVPSGSTANVAGVSSGSTTNVAGVPSGNTASVASGTPAGVAGTSSSVAGVPSGSTTASSVGGVPPTSAAGSSPTTGKVGTPTQTEKEARQAAKLEVIKNKNAEFAKLKNQLSALKGALASVVKMFDDLEKAMNAYQV